MEAEAAFVERALQRIFRGALVVGAAGTAMGVALQDWRWGLGFALGAAGASLNFYWLHRFVEGLAPGGPRPRKWLLVALATRYLALGLAGYVIVKVFGLSLAAILLGLFVPVAAIIFEIIYELLYARA
ncbi:MAG: hypothetical protein FJW34_08220 [Acidobacteria bacterium]|nr:hypothetical protein [Acidobacteriota bacterium]